MHRHTKAGMIMLLSGAMMLYSCSVSGHSIYDGTSVKKDRHKGAVPSSTPDNDGTAPFFTASEHLFCLFSLPFHTAPAHIP